MRKLTQDEIIFLGRMQVVRNKWQAFQAVGVSLYGPKVAQITGTIMSERLGANQMQGLELLACDQERRVLPFDPTASWWQLHDCAAVSAEQWQHAHQDVLIGTSLPEPLRTALQTYLEELLEIDFLQIWEIAAPHVMTFDLTTPPILPFDHLRDAAGQPIDALSIIRAGREWESVRTWARVRDYTRLLYGPQAAKMVITSLWVYNDSSYDQRPFFHVLNSEDRQIAYDLTLPWWQRFNFTSQDIAAYTARHAPLAPGERAPVDYEGINWEDGDDAFVAPLAAPLDTLRRDLLGIEFGEVWEYRDPDELAYDLLTPPALTFPEIFGEEVAAS